MSESKEGPQSQRFSKDLNNDGHNDTGSDQNSKSGHARFLRGLGRAAAGAIIFSLPLLMTMEMWNLGFYMDPIRLAILLAMSLPLLIGLSHVFGFEETFGWKDDLIDAFVALAVGFVSSGLVLLLLGVINHSLRVQEIIGKVELQMLPGSIGALLAQSQLGDRKEKDKQATHYVSEIFLMAVGALFLSVSIAPTEEIILIAHSLGKWQGFLLAVLSLTLMHVFVYTVDFKGTEKSMNQASQASIFLRFTVVGYAITLSMALFVLWTFGRTNGMALEEVAMIVVVLGFPAAIGAAAARLII